MVLYEHIEIRKARQPGGNLGGGGIWICHIWIPLNNVNLGADYMESFQPGLNFSPVNRAEIA